jgi:hypothetical protein
MIMNSASPNNVPPELQELLEEANKQLDEIKLTDEEREQVLNVIRNLYWESQQKQA